MKSHVINFFLVSLITILLVLSIFTKNHFKAEFFSNFHSPGEAIQYLKNIDAYKITEPNDDSHYGLNIEDSQTLNIRDNKYIDLTPISWTAFDYINKKVIENNEHIKKLQAEIFSSTKRTLELMGKLDIRESSQITDALQVLNYLN